MLRSSGGRLLRLLHDRLISILPRSKIIGDFGVELTLNILHPDRQSIHTGISGYLLALDGITDDGKRRIYW